MDKQIVEYSVNEAEISKMSDIYMNLTIQDLEDTEGFAAVHTARMVMVKHRTAVDKLRKSANENAQAFIKNNNANAKKLLELMEPIELHLKTEEDKIAKELERIKAEQFLLEKLKIQGRVNTLLAVNVVLPFFDLAMLDDNSYEKLLAEKTEAYKTEQTRTADEIRARQIMEAKLAIERVEIERVRKEQAEQTRLQEEERKKLIAERYAVEAAKQAIIEQEERRIFEEKAKESARIKAEAEADARIEREALEAKVMIEREARKKKDAEEAEAAEKVRVESLRPIKDRIHDYADDLLKEKPPVFNDINATHIIQWAVSELKDLSARIKLKADAL